MPKTKIDELLEHDDTCPDQNDPYRPQCIHDELDVGLRNLLIFDEDDPLPTSDDHLLEMIYEPEQFPDILPKLRELAAALDEVRSNEYRRDEFSYMRLAQSLCPMHGNDYQGCFEDDDPECSQIRAIFPGHDS